MKNKLLESKNFNIILKFPRKFEDFMEKTDKLSSYSRFLYFGSSLRQLEITGAIGPEFMKRMYAIEEKKINYAFFIDNMKKHSQLAQEWWQELIDRGCIKIMKKEKQ